MSSEFVVHIHEHLGPVKDRLSRVEAVTEQHTGAIRDIKNDIKHLDEKVDKHHTELLGETQKNYERMLQAFAAHDRKDEAVFDSMNSKLDGYAKEFNKIKWLVVGGITAITTLAGAFVFVADKIIPML
jgi:peptidoglycan hydrolase CwlO-like protein